MIVSKCHTDRFNQAFLILSEALTFIDFWLILLKYGFGAEISSFKIISLVSFALISNVIIGISKLVVKIYNFIKNKKTKVVAINEETTVKTIQWTKRQIN